MQVECGLVVAWLLATECSHRRWQGKRGSAFHVQAGSLVFAGLLNNALMFIPTNSSCRRRLIRSLLVRVHKHVAIVEEPFVARGKGLV